MSTARKYRKRPVVITAEQFDGQNDPAGVQRSPAAPESPYVVTIHDQRCYIEAGDWIVPEPDGVHFYPVKPDIFAATYDAVDDELWRTRAPWLPKTDSAVPPHAEMAVDEGEGPE